MLGKARKVSQRKACITLYNSMVLPPLDYCSCIWDGCRSYNLTPWTNSKGPDSMRPVRTQIGMISDQHEVFAWDWCELCLCSSRPWYVSVPLLFASLEWWTPRFRMLNEKTSDKQQQLLPPNSCTSKGQANERNLLSTTLNNNLSISSKWMKALECRLGSMIVSDPAKARVSEPFPTPSRSRSLSFGIGFTLLRWLSYLRVTKKGSALCISGRSKLGQLGRLFLVLQMDWWIQVD